MQRFLIGLLVLSIYSCGQKTSYDSIIRNGLIYDGNGGEPYRSDIAINNDSIVFIGDLSGSSAVTEIDADSVQAMITDGASRFTEVGPGKVLQGLVMKIYKEMQVDGVS